MLVSLAMISLLSALSSPADAARPVCGDGSVRGGESCDGADLDGQSCSSLGFAGGGALACEADCTFDTSACDAGSSVAVCGDGVAEDIEECDGMDDAACPGLCSDACACPATVSGDLEVHVIDVGQGDGILVVSPDGFTMLVDAGTNAQAATIQSYMGSVGLTSLDYVMVTHMDADHVGGMDGILAAFPEIVVAYDNGTVGTSGEYGEYDAAAGDRRSTLSTGQTIDLGPSMTVEAVHTHEGSSAENNNSNVIKLTYGSNSVLIGGDCESTCESHYDPGPTQVYKVHHHGASDSSSAAFLAQMEPDTALISCGAGNAYGHPHQDTLDRLDAAGATVYRTDLDGDLEVLVDGTAYTVNGEGVCADAATESCGDSDVGACSTGTRTCSGGAWGTCIGEVGPSAEVCDNGVDDDCDGATDLSDADCTPTSTQLQIVQVAYDTPGTDSAEEFVDLYNPTGADIALDGWTLADGAASWTLPAGTTIAAGGFLSIARDAAGLAAWTGVQPDIEGMTLSLNNGGDVLVLSDELGAEVDRVAWESFEMGWTVSAATGDSIVRTDVDVDTDSVADWSTLSPADPMGGTPDGGGTGGGTGGVDTCGDGVCDVGEDCTTCAMDCDGRAGGKPSNRYCCGNGTCEPVGEDAMTCAVDCG